MRLSELACDQFNGRWHKCVMCDVCDVWCGSNGCAVERMVFLFKLPLQSRVFVDEFRTWWPGWQTPGKSTGDVLRRPRFVLIRTSRPSSTIVWLLFPVSYKYLFQRYFGVNLLKPRGTVDHKAFLASSQIHQVFLSCAALSLSLPNPFETFLPVCHDLTSNGSTRAWRTGADEWSAFVHGTRA